MQTPFLNPILDTFQIRMLYTGLKMSNTTRVLWVNVAL